VRKTTTRSCRRWRAFGLLCLCAVCGALSAAGQIQSTVRELRETAFKNFTMGEFEAAIPDFQMLVETLKDVKTSQGLADLEPVYYNLAVCHFLTGQFAQSETAFVAYCKKYPRGARLSEAFVYIADSLRFASKNEAAIKAYKMALAKFAYGPDLRTDIHASIARCHLAMDDWASAREPLREAFLSAPDFLPKERPDRWTVNIEADGTIFSGQEAVTADALKRLVAERLKGEPDLKVYLRADKKTPHREVKAVMTAMAEAGVGDFIFGVFTPGEGGEAAP